MRKTLRRFSLCLLAAVTACDSGNAPPAFPLEAESPAEWPVNHENLVFAWESVAKNNAIGEGENRRVCKVSAKGGARYFRNFEMDPGGGFFQADEYSAETLRRVLDAGGAFSVEALVTPDGAQDGTIFRSATLGLFQRGNDLVFTAAEPSPVSARVGMVKAGKPVYFAAVYENGNWIFSLDGGLVEGEAEEAQGEATEEIFLRFGGDWEGKLMGIAMWGRALSLEEFAAHHRYWEERIAARPNVARLVLKGKLVRATPTPRPDNPDPYERALAGYTYEVEDVMEGEFEAGKLQVMHWVILDGKELKPFPREVGKSYVLEVEPFAAHPQLASEPASSLEEDFNLQNYYDVATRLLDSAAAVALSAGAISCSENGAPNPGREGFTERCRRAAEAAAESGSRSVRGADEDWFFLARELRHLGEGKVRKKDGSMITANGQDPVPFIAGFRDLLEERGIELLLVPVPSKAALYPDKLFEDAGVGLGEATVDSLFLRELAARGIASVDLQIPFAAMRRDGAGKLYCAQDTHWSPLGCETAARLIHEALEGRAWLTAAGRTEVERGAETTMAIRGDLVVEESGTGEEKLRVRYAGRPGPGGEITALPPDEESPVLLLGDSHVLVFHEGSARGMHCDRAGLADHLQHRLGFPIDVVGVRGSGMAAARRALLEHASNIPGYWEKKQLVIWCFASREFTQSTDKLLEIPLERG